MSRPIEIAIAGGGVIGLSIAYVLAREGVECAIFDRGPLGREASWAGAGLLPANCERVDTTPLNSLRTWSALLYPEWSAALLESTGIDNGYSRCGGVDVATTDEEAAALQVAAGRWRREGIVFEKLPPGDHPRVEPLLADDLRAVYFLPDRAQIRNPRHLRALETAVAELGVEIRPDEPIVGFERSGERIAAVRTDRGSVPCCAAVIAAGAWSGALVETLGIQVPTPPIKGEIVLLRSERPLLRRIIEHGRNYLVPRDDGRIVVGATEEDVGFDKRSTARGVAGLLEIALRVCPALAECDVERAWAGLRPGSIDTRPYVGTIPGCANLYIATGHRRAGLQLAPATAEIVADLVLGRAPRVDLSGFAPDRESSVEEEPTFRS